MDVYKTVTATFSSIVQQTLTVNITGNGSVGFSPEKNTYNTDEVVTLTAVADEGFKFDGWSGDLSGNGESINITMDADKTATATFSVLIKYSLTIDALENGSVVLSPIDGTYNEGSVVSLSAIPDVGYQFDGWSGDLSGNVNPENITMNADKSVGATFSQSPVFQQSTSIDGIVSLEAENFDSNLSQGGFDWVSGVATSGYSGMSYMQTTPDIVTIINTGYETDAPRLNFGVNFIKKGTHYIWIRGNDTGGGANSVHVGLNGSGSSSSDRIEYTNSGNWEWSKSTMDGVVASIDIPSTSLHTLNVWMREDGAILDKIILTTNTNYTPTEMGPEESTKEIFSVVLSTEDILLNREEDNALMIYPNPFNSAIKVKYVLPESGHVAIKVVDLTGRSLVELFSGNMKSGEHSLEIKTLQLEHLTKGVYLLRISGAGLNKTTTIIKK